MALSIGELVGYLRIDDSGVDDGLSQSERRISGWKVAAGAAGGAAGAAVGTALSAAMGAAVELDTANAKMAAQLNLTAEQAQAAGDLAGKLYAEGWGESATSVQETIKNVAANMNVAVDSVDMEPLARQAQQLSDVFDIDVTESTRAAGNMMRTLGMDGSAAMDSIAIVMQNGGARAEDLLDTLEEYPTQFEKLGLSGESAMGIINQGMMAGARNTDIVADALKEFSIRAQDGSKSAADSYKALGLNAEEMTAKVAAGGPQAAQALDQVLDALRKTKGQADASTIAFGLFGTQSEDLGAALYALDPSEAAGQMSDLDGTVARAGETMSDTAASKIETMKRSLEMLGQQAVTTDGPLGFLSAGVAAFGPAAIGMAGSLAMIGMAIGPLLIQMGSMIVSAVTTAAVWVAQWVVMAAGAVARAAVMAASWLIAMGPVGWVIALVVGLVALIIANWDTVVSWTTSAWQAVSDFIVSIWNAIVAWVTNAVTSVVNFVVSAWTSFQAANAALWSMIQNAISAAWAFITGLVSGAIANVVSFFTNGWANVKSATSAAWDFLRNAVSSGIDNVLSFVRSLPGKVLDALASFGTLLLNVGRDLVNGLWNGISAGWSWLTGKVQDLASSLLDAAKSALGIASPSKEMRDEVGKWLPAGIGVGIIANAKSATDAARELAAQTAAGARAGAMGALGRIDTGTFDSAALRASFRPRGGDGANTPGVSVVINNPLPETGSDSITRNASTLAKLGPDW